METDKPTSVFCIMSKAYSRSLGNLITSNETANGLSIGGNYSNEIMSAQNC